MTPYYEQDGRTIYCLTSAGMCANVLLKGNGNDRNRRTQIDKGRTTSPQIQRREYPKAKAGAEVRLQTDNRPYRETQTMGARSPRVEGRCYHTQVGVFQGASSDQIVPLPKLRQQQRATPHRRQPTKQPPRERNVFMPSMPHGRGWAP